ncbi:MAG TPA: hypothetical protein VGE79_07660 [Niastella sp.]
MIQTTKRIVTCALFVCLSGMVYAQDQTASTTTDQSLPESDTAIATRHALRFADSLVKADFYVDWNTYLNLSCPSAYKFYGGKDGFKENAVTIHFRDEPKTEEKVPKVQMLRVMNDGVEKWQCVIEKVREKWDETRGKVKIYTYLVGESNDNGLNWAFVDVSHNSIQNLIYILPTIFTSMEIPEGKTVYVDEVATQQAAMEAQAAQAKQQAAKKKPPVKKATK